MGLVDMEGFGIDKMQFWSLVKGGGGKGVALSTAQDYLVVSLKIWVLAFETKALNVKNYVEGSSWRSMIEWKCIMALARRARV